MSVRDRGGVYDSVVLSIMLGCGSDSFVINTEKSHWKMITHLALFFH